MLFSNVLYILVRHASPSGPMCLRCLMSTLSGPVELLFLLCFIAAWTCVVLSVMRNRYHVGLRLRTVLVRGPLQEKLCLKVKIRAII